MILETWIGRLHGWFYFETFNQRIVVKEICWGLLIRIGQGDEWGLARQTQSIFFCQLFPLLFSYFSLFFLSSLSLSNFMGRGCQLFPLLIDFIFASAKYFSLKTSANLNGFQQKANLLGKTTFSVFPSTENSTGVIWDSYVTKVFHSQNIDLSFYCLKMNHLKNFSFFYSSSIEAGGSDKCVLWLFLLPCYFL